MSKKLPGDYIARFVDGESHSETEALYTRCCYLPHAALNKFSIRQATLIGPTPPGVGV